MKVGKAVAILTNVRKNAADPMLKAIKVSNG